MSRTFRKPSKMYKELEKVRDGTPTKSSHKCENNGDCPYCKSTRLHKNNKKITKKEALKELEEDYEF
jgi:hypothetical protein